MKDVIFDFVEENWTAFRRTCKDHGIPDDEVENKFDEFKKGLQALDNQSIGRGLRDSNTVTYDSTCRDFKPVVSELKSIVRLDLLSIINKILRQSPISHGGRFVLDISDFCNYRISKMLCEKPSWCDDCPYDEVETRHHNLTGLKFFIEKSLDKG